MSSWSSDPRCVVSRHDLAANLTPAGVQATIVGDSLIQGSGTSGGSSVINYRLAAALTGYTGLSGFSVANRGVGGTGAAVALSYVADIFSAGSSGKAYPQSAVSGAKSELHRPVLIVNSLRNDVYNTTPGDYLAMIELVFRQCRKKGIATIFLMPPPQLTWDGNPGDSWGIRDNDPTIGETYSFDDYYSPLVDLCAQMDVSLVDYWKLCWNFAQNGFDLRTIMHDASHWNDAGCGLATSLLLQCLARTRDAAPVDWDDAAASLPDVIVNYAPYAGVTTTTSFTGLSSVSTARIDELAETATYGFSLGAGQSQTYRFAAPIKGVVVDFLGGATGNVSVTVGSTSLGTASCMDTVVRENSTAMILGTGSAAYNAIDDIVIANTSGTPTILGVKALCANQLNADDSPACILSTSDWAVGVFGGTGSPFNTHPCWTSSTPAAQIQFNIVGRYLVIYYTTAASRGKFSFSVDGGAAQTIDCYHNGASNQVPCIIDLASEGEHYVTFTTVTKNPSASSNLVQIGSFRSFTDKPSSLRQLLPQAGVGADCRQLFTNHVS